MWKKGVSNALLQYISKSICLKFLLMKVWQPFRDIWEVFCNSGVSITSYFLRCLGFLHFKRQWKPSKWTNTLATVIPFVPISFFFPLHKGLLRSLLFHYLPPRLAHSHHSLISKRQYFLCFGTNPWAVTASTSPVLAAEEQKVRHWESQRQLSVLHPAPPRAQPAPPPPPHCARADRLRAVIRGLNI